MPLSDGDFPRGQGKAHRHITKMGDVCFTF